MKSGDLVRCYDPYFKTEIFLYGGDEQPWDEYDQYIPTDIPFRTGDIGIVLCTKKSTPGYCGEYYVKLITSRGVGWVAEEHVQSFSRYRD